MNRLITFRHAPTCWLFMLLILPVVAFGQSHPKAILTSARLAELQDEYTRPEYLKYADIGQAYLNKSASRGPGGYALFSAIWNNAEYIDNAIEGLKGMGTGPRDSDLREADYIIQLSAGYDVLYNHMNSDERSLLRSRLADAASHMSQQVVNGIWWTRESTNNHNWVNFAAIGLAGFTLQGEDSRALTWIEQAMANHTTKVHEVLDAASDGSWHEGLGYQNFGIRQYLTFLTAARNNGYADIDDNGMLRNVGRYTLYTQVPDLTHAGTPYERRLHVAIHGDANWVRPGRLILTNYNARRFQDPYAQLASDNWAYWYPRDSECFTYALAMIFYDPDLPSVDINQIPDDHYAEDQEAVFMRSGWNEGDIVLMLKAGPWSGRGNFERVRSGNADGETWNVSHTHNDDLGITIWGEGDWLMPEASAYNCCNGGRYAHAVEFHNSFLINDKGQIGDDRPANGSGQSYSPDWATRDATIPLHVSTEHYSFARASGPDLYEPSLEVQQLDRMVALCRDSKYMTVYDEVGLNSPLKVEQIFHFRDDVSREGDWIRGVAETDPAVTSDPVNLGIRVISPSSFEMTEGSQYVNYNDPIDDLEGDDNISYAKIRPSSASANTKFLEVLWPATSSEWNNKPNIQPLEVDHPEYGMSVPLIAGSAEMWIYNSPGATTSAGGITIAQGEIGVLRKDANDEPLRIVLLGPGVLKDRNGVRTLIEKSDDGVLEVDINGNRADLSGTSLTNRVRFYGPNITEVFIDGAPAEWEHTGDIVTIGEVSGPLCLPVTASSHDGNGPENVLDGELSTRWSAEGDGQWLQFCLGEEAKNVYGVKIAFYKGNERITTFDIQASLDQENWTVVDENLLSSGNGTELEQFSFTPINARYIRIIGHGNNSTSSSGWNSITEVEIIQNENGEISSTALYPFGEEYPLGLYALYADHNTVSDDHWNCGHTYGEAPVSSSYFETCEENNLNSMARLSAVESDGIRSPQPRAVTIGEVQQQAVHDNLSWWDIPEELRYWYDSEFEIVQEYTSLTRQYDPRQRPNYMYLPGHYSAENIENYVPYLDIIPASCYTNHMGQPHSYVRWSIERTKEAIANQGYTLGRDYLNNEKTVMAILELYESGRSLTEEGTWHDFWLSVASDVKGVLVYSHFYRDKSPSLAASWIKLNEAVRVFKKNGIDKALLQGSNNGLSFSVANGPALAPSFQVGSETIQYPSLKLLAKEWNDTTYVVVVNSAEQEVAYQLEGISSPLNTGLDLLSADILEIQNEILKDTLPALGVSLFKLYTGDAQEECYTASSENWQNINFQSGQSGIFTAEADVIPSETGAASALALAFESTSSWEGQAATVLFSDENSVPDMPANSMLVRNGDEYMADQALIYEPGLSYHIRMVVDVVSHTYSVLVTPQGANEVVLATGYSFRNAQQSITSLNVWNIATGIAPFQACNLSIATPQPCNPVIASSDDGAGSIAEHAIDGDLTTRWSAEGNGEWIQLCLQDTKVVSGIDIAFHNGDQRVNTFDIQLSLDGASWSTVAENLQSSGNYLSYEQFIFPAEPARFVKIVGHGNTDNNWNSYTEIKIKTDTTTAYVAGQTYFGSNNYIEYLAGNSPVIISVPHGGSLKPTEIPDRDCDGCVYVNDAYTVNLAKEIKEAYYTATGTYPHIIINNLHRTKLDANRDLKEAADENLVAEQAWYEFHNFIETAREEVLMTAGKGLFLDIHGHGHDIQRLEIGYLLSKNSLQQSDETLNTSSYQDASSLKHLIQTNITGLTHAELLRGMSSFGSLIENSGFAGVPSGSDPFPHDDDLYFSGGYNTKRYSSLLGGTIDGIQIECNQDVRFDETNRLLFAESLALVIEEYLDVHYFSGFADIFSSSGQSTVKITGNNLTFDENVDQSTKSERSILVYPNPFSKQLTIVYKVKKGTSVKVDLYTLAGIKVATLQEGNTNAEAGIYQLEAAKYDLKTGTYMLRIITEEGVDERRLIYLE